MKERIVWIDYAKFIGIYFVVLGHLPVNANLVVFLYSFHIPLFIFLSGYLCKRDKNMNLIYNIRSLIIPYILLYCLYWIYPIIRALMNNSFTWMDNIIKPFWGLCLGNGYSGVNYTMLNIPLYFLIALFWVRILFNLYNRITSIGAKITILLSCIAFIYVRNYIGFDLYLSIDSAIMAFPFFVIGNCLSHNKWNINFPNRKSLLILVIITAALFELLLCTYNGRVDINHCLYGVNIFLFYISGMVGVLMTVAFSSLFSKKSFVKILSNGTMLIIAFGTASASLILFVLQIWDINADVKYVISAFGALILLYPIIMLVQRYFPILLGKSQC